MRTLYSHCPNPDCRYHKENAPPRWYCKWGYFRERINGQLVPRYRCRYCRRCFSTSTFKTTYRQKKPEINEPLRRALCEGMGIRPASRAFKVSKSTILKKLRFLGELSEKICREKRENGDLNTGYVQFDEMMIFERTQCLPITLALAVRAKTGEIISARVGVIPCETSLKKVSLEYFGPRKNEREKTLRQMLKDIHTCVRDQRNFTIASDSRHQYRDWIRSELPFANIQRHSGADLKAREKAMATVDWNLEPIDYSNTDNYGPFIIKTLKNGKRLVRAYDPLLTVNQKCMKLRASLSRMRRDFWGYSQKVENLQLHLWLFVALHNGYELPTKKRALPDQPKNIEQPKSTPAFDFPFSLDRINHLNPSECSINRNGIVVISPSFQREHGIEDKLFHRLYFDPQRKIIAITFHDEEPRASRIIRNSNSFYIYIRSLLRKSEFLLDQVGKFPILWDAEQKCVFVMMNQALKKKDV